MAIKAIMTIEEISMILSQLKETNQEEVIEISSTNRLPFVNKKRDGSFVDSKTGEECEVVQITISSYIKELEKFLEDNKQEMEDQEMEMVIKSAKYLSGLRKSADEFSFVISTLDRRFLKRKNLVLAQDSLDQGRRWLGKILGFIQNSPYKDVMKPEDVIDMVDAHNLVGGDILGIYPKDAESITRLRIKIELNLIEECSIEKMQNKDWIYLNTKSAFLVQYMWECFRCFTNARMFLGESYKYFK